MLAVFESLVFIYDCHSCWERVWLCVAGCLETQCVDQDGLRLKRNCLALPQVLGLEVCATTAQHFFLFLHCWSLNLRFEAISGWPLKHLSVEVTHLCITMPSLNIYILAFFCCCCCYRVSLHSTSWPRTHYVDRSWPQTDIHLPPLPKCFNQRHLLPPWILTCSKNSTSPTI